MEAQRDPYTWILLQRSRLSAALLGFPIEINQRKIVSSPSEAFDPAAAVGRTDPSPLIKFLASSNYYGLDYCSFTKSNSCFSSEVSPVKRLLLPILISVGG